jgi:GDPmannose 4,6-dehydratase
LAEVVKTEPVDYRGWLYDLATTTGTFHAGVGQGWIHNSPRRGLEFVTHKITNAVARIKLGLASELRLGNLEARRDWGYAGDYVRAMWLMLQQDEPDDYVIATGETHSVQEFVEEAFGYADLDWRRHVVQDPKFYRPAEVDLLVGDASKAGRMLGWEPTVDFRSLVRLMVDTDLRILQYPDGGYPDQAEEAPVT